MDEGTVPRAPGGDERFGDPLDGPEDPWPWRAGVLAAGLVLAVCALIGSAVAQGVDLVDAFSGADTTLYFDSADGRDEPAADDPFGDDEGKPSDEPPGGTFPPFLTVPPDADGGAQFPAPEPEGLDYGDRDDVEPGLSLGPPSDFDSARQAIAMAAGGTAEPIVGGLLVAAVLLAVLDDILTGSVAARRSRLAMITLWGALVAAGVVMAAGGYVAYEVFAGTRLRFFSSSDTWLLLHSLTGAGLAGLAGWLALRALDDTGRAELAQAHGPDGTDEPGGDWEPAT